MSYVGFIPIFLIVVILNARLMSAINYAPPIPPVLGFILNTRNPWIISLFILQVGLVAPFVEELFFRGFMYNALKKRLNMFSAIVITSAVFALVHTELMHFIPIAFLSFLLVYVYEKTGSLFAAVVIHSIHNLATMYLALLVKSLLI